MKLRANYMETKDDKAIADLVQTVLDKRGRGHELRIEIDEEVRVYYTENPGKKSATEHRFYQSGKLISDYCRDTIDYLEQL